MIKKITHYLAIAVVAVALVATLAFGSATTAANSAEFLGDADWNIAYDWSALSSQSQSPQEEFCEEYACLITENDYGRNSVYWDECVKICEKAFKGEE